MQDLVAGIALPLTQKENVNASPLAPVSMIGWRSVFMSEGLWKPICTAAVPSSTLEGAMVLPSVNAKFSALQKCGTLDVRLGAGASTETAAIQLAFEGQ